MIEMDIKRGHRRLIQREITAYKGIPRDQPLISNVMGTKFNNAFSSIKIDQRRTSYEHPIMTGLTSPMSMSSSGIGGSTTATMTNTSGNNSSSGSGSSGGGGRNTILHHHYHHLNNNKVDRFRMQQQHADDRKAAIPDKYVSESNNTNNNSSYSSNDDDDSTASGFAPMKRKYRHHPKPDKSAPIKPPSAYIMFSNNYRNKVTDQNLSFAELAKVVGDQWKNMCHKEKQSYERMAMLGKDEYLAALERYKHTAEYRKYQEYLKEFKEKQAAFNSYTGRSRKKTKQKYPDSASLADSSSNGNSNGSGSSGSGSTDIYGDHEAVIQRQNQASPSDKNIRRSNYSPPVQQNSRAGYPNTRNASNGSDDWDYRSSQMMRGIIPVEFVETEPVKPAISSATSNDEIQVNSPGSPPNNEKS
ncbi:hypothetical protein K501DRAFT_294617 [Backusella circina FSU 941]|nr:hypothetical protein K501DRAFT_294617 [Backusella circina FSU 941]